MLRPPSPIRGSVRARDYYDITVGVPNPNLPVIRSAVSIGRISVARQHNPDTHFDRTLRNCIEIVDLKPKQHAVSVRSVVRIADPAVMMFHLEAVQLKHKLLVRDELLIGGTSMITSTAQQALVPLAARFHIGHGN